MITEAKDLFEKGKVNVFLGTELIGSYTFDETVDYYMVKPTGISECCPLQLWEDAIVHLRETHAMSQQKAQEATLIRNQISLF